MSWLFPSKKDFFKMLSGQTEKAVEALNFLLEFVSNPSEEKAKRIKKVEGEADELRRILIDELNQTFVTPIDREDIFDLSRAIDDVIDYANTTAEEMALFKIVPDVYIKSMAETLLRAVEDFNLAVANLKRHPGICAEHLVRARKAENKIERFYREGLVKLFETNDVINIMKTREVYRHLSNAADRVVESTNILGGILMKMS